MRFLIIPALALVYLFPSLESVATWLVLAFAGAAFAALEDGGAWGSRHYDRAELRAIKAEVVRKRYEAIDAAKRGRYQRGRVGPASEVPPLPSDDGDRAAQRLRNVMRGRRD